MKRWLVAVNNIETGRSTSFRLSNETFPRRDTILNKMIEMEPMVPIEDIAILAITEIPEEWDGP